MLLLVSSLTEKQIQSIVRVGGRNLFNILIRTILNEF